MEEYRGAKSLLALARPMSPGVAARMAINPDSADERYIGTLKLANAYFGGQQIYIELYEKAVTDESANVRSAGVRGLANHGTPDHVPILVATLRDSDRNVRLESARGLQRLHNPVAIPELIRVIDDSSGYEEDPDVRAEAADALGQYANSRVLSPLIGALADHSLIVNVSAADSLKTLTGQQFRLDRVAWFAWYKDADDPFAGRTTFYYPVFHRDKKWYEWIPFVSQPPNEPPATPVGMPPIRPSQNQPTNG